MAGEQRVTTGELLREGIDALHASGSETARLDAELLLGDAVGVGRTVILAHPAAPVGADAAARFRADLARRVAGEPVAYIRGMKEFYGLALSVDARALIPRPETERLVELGEAEVRGRLPAVQAASQARIRVVDVGTGSGAVVVALAVLLRRLGAVDRVELTATDVSEDALALARENAVVHAVADVIGFERGDLFAAAMGSGAQPPFDVVLANLPYVRHDAIPGLPIAASFEPTLALDGGEDGLEVIQRLLEQLPVSLAPGGVALLEIGADQGEGIKERVAVTLAGWACVVERDLAGLPRVARIQRG